MFFLLLFFSAGMSNQETFLIRNTHRALPATAPAPPPLIEPRPSGHNLDTKMEAEHESSFVIPRGLVVCEVNELFVCGIQSASGASARGFMRRTPLLPSVLRGRAAQGGVLPDLQAACGLVLPVGTQLSPRSRALAGGKHRTTLSSSR